MQHLLIRACAVSIQLSFFLSQLVYGSPRAAGHEDYTGQDPVAPIFPGVFKLKMF